MWCFVVILALSKFPEQQTVEICRAKQKRRGPGTLDPGPGYYSVAVVAVVVVVFVVVLVVLISSAYSSTAQNLKTNKPNKSVRVTHVLHVCPSASP